MATLSTINLIRTKTSTTPQMDAITKTLSRIRTFSIIALVVGGAVSGGLYYYFSTQKARLTETKTTLVAAVDAQRAKEGLIVSIKQRADTVGKILASQTNLTRGFDDITAIVGAGTVLSVSLDEGNKVIVDVSAASLEDVITIVQSVKQQIDAKAIRDAKLLSLTTDKGGNFLVTIGFTGLF